MPCSFAALTGKAVTQADGSTPDDTPHTSPSGDLTKQPWRVGQFSEVLMPGVTLVQHRFKEAPCPKRAASGWQHTDY